MRIVSRISWRRPRRSQSESPIDLSFFQSDEMLQVWVIHHLQVIGEAARGLQSVRDAHPEIPWPQIVALRNILVHEYFGLNMHQVWTMAQKDVPDLEARIQRIRSQTASGSVLSQGSDPAGPA